MPQELNAAVSRSLDYMQEKIKELENLLQEKVPPAGPRKNKRQRIEDHLSEIKQMLSSLQSQHLTHYKFIINKPTYKIGSLDNSQFYIHSQNIDSLKTHFRQEKIKWRETTDNIFSFEMDLSANLSIGYKLMFNQALTLSISKITYDVLNNSYIVEIKFG